MGVGVRRGSGTRVVSNVAQAPNKPALTHRIPIRLNTWNTKLAMLSQVHGFRIADKEKP